MTRHTNSITPPSARNRRGRALLAAATAVAASLTVAFGTGSASAASSAAGWTIDSLAVPSSFSANDNAACTANQRPGCDGYLVTATDAGNQAADGSAVTLTDTLPAGLTVQKISFFWSGLPASLGGPQTDLGSLCTATPAPSSTPVECSLDTNAFGLPPIAPDDTLEMRISVTVDDPNETATLTNSATVSGGGAPDATTSAQNSVGMPAPGFGPATFTSTIAGLDGTPDTQAGDHPYELTTRIDLHNEFREAPEGGGVTSTSPQDVKDVVVDLPVGFLGSALATPQCSFAQLESEISDGTGGCPQNTIVGHILSEPAATDSVDGPIYNMIPEQGVAAEFGYVDQTGGTHVLDARVVPTTQGYVLQVTARDVPQISLTDIVTTFFGDPAAKDATGSTPVAMFTNPTDCSGQPLTTTMYMDSWQNPGSFNADGTPNLSDPNWVSATSSSPPVTGCDQLQFNPSLSAQPDTTVADSPSGLLVDISLAQPEDPGTLATPPLKDASVVLPAGFTVNPSSAAWLKACTSGEIDLSSASPPTCPSASQIGTVQLTTPLEPGTLSGEIYLAQEFDNPFDSILAGYIVVNDPKTGIVIKIPGNLTPDPATGQITGVFDNNPQFPFSDLRLDFTGGPTGVLATPESCGTFTTDSVFSPWSFPDSGPAATPSDSFQITGGCVAGFHPSFTAGSRNAQAGAYTPFGLSLFRTDADQNFQGLSVTLPPGVLARLAGVSECSESELASISSQPGTAAGQIANPSCPANSQVGTVTTGAGVGPDPFFLGGKVYLTGPYKGAPYGLAVVVPVIAGPLDLGTVVVRQALDINPTTAQVTDVSDPFPTILDGIPLRIRRVDVVLNRPQFTINPTNCDPMSVTGKATSTQDTTADLSSRFQVGGCASLPFRPKLKMSLTGKGQTKSGDHPTLTSILTQKAGQANISRVRVSLPLNLALDPNNTQHVCDYQTARAVTTGPANCPASTLVGHATAITPLLSEPLAGPVYLVQGLSFKGGVETHTLPTLLIPLRGQIALDLRAQTSVSHNKLVTTFPTIPDAAVSKFTLTINGGKKGILVITGRGRSLCGKRQISNANLIAQSGKTSHPDVRMNTPCPTAHLTSKHSHHRRRR